MNAPHIPLAVVEWLESTFPNEIPPTLLEDPRQYDMLVGIQRVVRKVRYEHEQSLDNHEREALNG